MVTCKNTGIPDLGGLLPVASKYIPDLGPKPLFYEAGNWHSYSLPNITNLCIVYEAMPG